MNLIEEIQALINKLNEVDEYNQSLGDKLSLEDKKICDLLHYIENNRLSAFECYRIVKELRSVRVIRRKIKNDIEIAKTLDANKNKLISKDYRQFLISELYKKDKQLNTKYNNRYYQENEIEGMLKSYETKK